MTYPGDSGEGAAGKQSPPTTTEGNSSASASSTAVDKLTMDELRAEVTRLRDCERQIAELLKSKSSDRVLHDLRNLLNEVQLLRILAEQSNA